MELNKRGMRIIFAMLMIVSLTLLGCTKNVFYIHSSLQEEMDKAVESDFDGMIVLVNQAGVSSFYSAGYDNRENQTLADPHSLFKIASISKLYLAAAATKLIVADSLELDAKLTELLPEVKDRIEYAEDITLKMLLQHRSGIKDWSYEPEIAGENYDDYMSFVARVYDKPANFKPNKKYSYSNTNYLLLAEIMNRTLGYSHQDFIQVEILNPLGLVNTFHAYKDADTNKVMSGYVKGWDADVRSIDFPLPGGNMIATAEDVGIFLRALVDGSLLSPEEQQIYSEVYKYGHTGWLPGYTSIARYHSDIDAVVVQFVNTSGKEIFWLKLESMYNKIIHCVENEKL